MVMRVMAWFRRFLIMIVMMIMLTNNMADLMRDGMHTSHRQAHTHKGEKQEQCSKQARH